MTKSTFIAEPKNVTPPDATPVTETVQDALGKMLMRPSAMELGERPMDRPISSSSLKGNR